MVAEALKISVIIGTYNRRHCLGRTVDSVLSQTHANRELIIVDDVSTDGTPDWLRAAYPSVTVIQHAVNRGVAVARNTGLEKASGQLVAFLDSDDWWTPDFLERHARALALEPQAVLSYCECSFRLPDGSEINIPRIPPPPVESQAELMLIHQPIATPSSVLFRTDRVREVGGFREKCRNSEDVDLYLRLVNRGPFVRLPQTLAMKTKSVDSKSNNHAKWSHHRKIILDDFFAAPENAAHRHLERSARAKIYANIGLAALRDGDDRPLALRLLAASFLADPFFSLRYLFYRLFRRATRGLR